MRIVRYTVGQAGPRLGAMPMDSDETIIDLRDALAALLAETMDTTVGRELAAARIPDDAVTYIRGNEPTWSAGREAFEYGLAHEGPFRHPRMRCRLLLPIWPRVLIMGGANFYDHLDETKRGKPDEVEFFLKSTSAVIGPNEPVFHDPKLSQKYDYEVELGIVIGRAGRNIPLEKAFDHIFGYTIVNDISLRDQQIIPWDEGRFQIRFGQGKSYLTGGPIGPWIVTKDDLPDVSSLALRTWVDDELRQNNSLENIIWDVPHLVSYYSQFMTLRPGFVLASGTPGGAALGSDLELGADPYEREDIRRGLYMHPGDLVRCEVEGVGALENRLISVEEVPNAN